MEFFTWPVIIGGGIALTIVAWIKIVKSGPICKNMKDLTGKTVIVTGANRGIGKAIALGLAKRNARVIIPCRNIDSGLEAAKDIRRDSGNNEVHPMKLDLADMNSIRDFVEEFLSSELNLHILVNNAAIVHEGKTKNGYDLMFGTNHLGPFLLTNLLLPILKKTAKKYPVRIVNLASDAYKLGTIDFDNISPTIDRRSSSFQVFLQYANTKLMTIYFTTELDKRLRKEGRDCNNITVYAVHPGAIHTGIGAELADERGSFSWLSRELFTKICCRSTFYACQTPLYCCLEDGLEEKSGKYFYEMKMVKLLSIATDEKVGSMLWKRSEEMCGL